MKNIILFILIFFCPIIVLAQAPVITPLNPVTQPGGTDNFSCSSSCGTGGTWSVTNNGGAGLGSIVSGTGVYTAPSTYIACTSLGGYQLLPCDHIFNTNISSLPVNAGGTNLTITSATRTSNVVTLVLAGGGYTSAVNTLVTISGSSDSTFNATNVAVGAYCGNTCLTYANPGSNASSTGGNLFVPYISGMGTIPVNFLPSFAYNYTNGSTPTQTVNFYYTPSNNGTYEVPQWPVANIQNGWFGALAGENADHHLITIDTTNGNVGELYQYYAQAPVTTCTVNISNSATCTITPTNTSPGFQRIAAVGHSVELGGFTSGDTYLNGTFVMTAATATSITFNITHAAATTSTTGQVTAATGGVRACAIAGNCVSQSGDQYAYSTYNLPQNGSTTAAGNTIASTALRTEELVDACENGGSINHLGSITLANGYIANAHLWPSLPSGTGGGGTTPYGLRVRLKSSFVITGFSACAQKILTWFKNYGLMVTDGGAGWQVNVEYGPLPLTEVTALKAVAAANIAVTNWEAVDESALMESSTSGASNKGEYVCFTSSTGTTCTNVALIGTSVNAPLDQVYAMAGAPAFQLTGYSAAGGITWSMSPTVGSITSGGLYTPPASVTVGTLSTTTVTATSSVNGSVTSIMHLFICPATNCNFTQDTANFTDSHSVVWFGGYGIGLSNAPSWQGCCQNDASFAAITDKQLWWNHYYSSQTQSDLKMDFHVANGTYSVVQNSATNLASGADVRNFYGQGVLLTTVDSTIAAGGQHLPYTLTSNVTVSNNILSVYNGGIGIQTSNAGDISSIKFTLNPVGCSAVSPSPNALPSNSPVNGVINCFFIDAVGGLDTNTGADEAHAWQHAPCMANATSNAASHTVAAGDGYIFKGGVSWTNASFPCSDSTSGTSSAYIYFGVDTNWFTGGAWARPIATAGSSPIAGSFNQFFHFRSQSFLGIYGFEMTGYNWTTDGSFGTNAYVDVFNAPSIWMGDLYLHGWTHPAVVGTPGAGTCGSGCSDSLNLIFCNGISSQGTVFDHGIIDGSDSSGGGDSGEAFKECPGVQYSVIHNLPNGILWAGAPAVMHDNHIYKIRGFNGSGGALGSGGLAFDGGHDNFAEDNNIGSTSPSTLFYNNLIGPTGCGEGTFYGNPGSTGDTTTSFNNIYYDLTDTDGLNTCNGNMPHLESRDGAWTGNFYNNTVYNNFGQVCFQGVGSGTGVTITLENNHCIANAGLDSLGGYTVTRTTNFTMTTTQATAAGYTDLQTFVFSPTSTNCSGQLNCPVGAGTNLSGIATGSLAALAFDTTYGGTRTTNARPSVWDAGAYQFVVPPTAIGNILGIQSLIGLSSILK